MKSAPWLVAELVGVEVGRSMTLEPAEARHATGALRLRDGDRVLVTDGAGVVASGPLARRGRGVVEVLVEEVERVPRPEPGPSLAVGVLAGSAMDVVVQKATELGVERLIPVCCERSQMGPERARSRAGHWRRVARQALKQCRRAWALELAPPAPLTELIADGQGRGILAHPEGGTVEDLPDSAGRLLLVGPEGGFSPDEERALEAAGWPKLRLGGFVLRSETAAIAGAAVLAAWSEVHSGNDC